MGYRPDGLRAWKVAGIETTYYIYAGGKLLYSIDNFGIINGYGWGTTLRDFYMSRASVGAVTNDKT